MKFSLLYAKKAREIPINKVVYYQYQIYLIKIAIHRNHFQQP